MSAAHVLDDVAWHALTGPHAHLAESAAGGLARRYRDDIAPFCGVQHLDARGWAALAELVGPAVRPSSSAARSSRHRSAGSSCSGSPPPSTSPATSPSHRRPRAGRSPSSRHPTCPTWSRWRRPPSPARSARTATSPGAGSASGAVAGSSRWRGSGCGSTATARCRASASTRWSAARAWARSSRWPRHTASGSVATEAMLHVRDGNDGAHRLYRRVGFEVRRPVTVAVLRPAS